MSSSIIRDDLINYKIAYELHKQGYDMFKNYSNFYQDDCTPANIDQIDIGFYNRIEDFYPNNIEFCLENCSYIYTDYDLKRFICNCTITEEKKIIK